MLATTTGIPAVFTIVPIKEVHAKDILTWKYSIPYDFYDPPQDDFGAFYVKQFLRPEYAFHSILDAADDFIGFCSFGIDGQIVGGDYSLEALDIGLGMRPNFTGQGYGELFFNAIEDFARQNFHPVSIRLTVATFNCRAMHLYKSFGYLDLSSFTDQKNDVDYKILIKHFTKS